MHVWHVCHSGPVLKLKTQWYRCIILYPLDLLQMSVLLEQMLTGYHEHNDVAYTSVAKRPHHSNETTGHGAQKEHQQQNGATSGGSIFGSSAGSLGGTVELHMRRSDLSCFSAWRQ